MDKGCVGCRRAQRKETASHVKNTHTYDTLVSLSIHYICVEFCWKQRTDGAIGESYSSFIIRYDHMALTENNEAGVFSPSRLQRAWQSLNTQNIACTFISIIVTISSIIIIITNYHTTPSMMIKSYVCILCLASVGQSPNKPFRLAFVFTIFSLVYSLICVEIPRR